MNTYTGWQYLLIDVANNFGLDKLTFEDRIKWATNELNNLEELTHDADSKPLYIKAVQAVRKAQAGLPSGHMVALDACCSGIQIMSAMTGCVVGATNTGLVNPDVRADAYSTLTEVMNDILDAEISVPRKHAKEALMTVMYGSKAKPKEIFGEDTPEISAFYQAAEKIAPGAYDLLQDLLGSWQPYALVHQWKLPDGFTARIKVMQKKEARIEVDELNHASFTYEFYENEGSKKGLSNVANVVHSVDAYVLRSMHRRCNYDIEIVEIAAAYISEVLGGSMEFGVNPSSDKLLYYIEQYKRSGMADIVILPYINSVEDAASLSNDHLKALSQIISTMLPHKPFPLVTIHDAFAAHPNNLNHVRQHYIDIFAEIAQSNILSDILSQIHGAKGSIKKLSTNLSDLIKGSNYALS
jgi:hypothetical protein